MSTSVMAGLNSVAAENVVLEDAGESPGCAAIRGISPAGLPEVGRNAVELPKSDCHLAGVCWVNGDGRLVRGVADDIHAVRIDIHLVAREGVVLRDHPRRNRGGPQWERSRRIVVFFEWLRRVWLGLS